MAHEDNGVTVQEPRQHKTVGEFMLRQVVITPEMVEAGKHALRRNIECERVMDFDDDIVCAVFRAMESQLE